MLRASLALDGGGGAGGDADDSWGGRRPTPLYSRVERAEAAWTRADADGVTPLVVAPRIELTLEWLIESPPPEHTWEEPPIFYDGEPPPPPPPPSDGCRLLPAAMPSRRPPLLLFCFLDLHLADRCAHRYLPRPQLLTRSEPEAGGSSPCISD